MRIAPDEVSIADARAIKSVYGVGKGFAKTDFYDSLQPPIKTPLGGLFQQRDEKLHSKRLRIVAPIYTMANVLKSEDHIDLCIQKLFMKFDLMAERQSSVDLSLWMQASGPPCFEDCSLLIPLYSFAADVIGELFFGKSFEFLDEANERKLWQQREDRRGPTRWSLMVSQADTQFEIMKGKF